MRVLLDLMEPSTHWIALARVIENNPDLPGDVVMVVRKDGVVLRHADGTEVSTDLETGSFADGTVSRLEGKMAFLEWLHTRFPANPNVSEDN